MAGLLKSSPIMFDIKPARTEQRDGWRVTLEYEGQGGGPFLVDLSHRPRWDIQDSDLSRFKVHGLDIPEKYNAACRNGGLLISRMNRTACQVWSLSGEIPELPADNGLTEITDGQALLSLLGTNVDAIAETITTLDLFGPGVDSPCLFQGPVLHIPCQIIRLENVGDMQAILIGFSRGYGQAMADAILKSGLPYNLRPGGERVFSDFFGARTK